MQQPSSIPKGRDDWPCWSLTAIKLPASDACRLLHPEDFDCRLIQDLPLPARLAMAMRPVPCLFLLVLADQRAQAVRHSHPAGLCCCIFRLILIRG
jgi:hypothetical protein